MYVAVKGGEKAISNAHALLSEERRGDLSFPEISLEQISEQLTLAVDRVMTEGSLYDRELAALAIKQARGDLIEAIFLMRAYKTTLPRYGFSKPVNTEKMHVRRRVSATFKDLPGGQILGPTYDYTHRLLDFDLAHTNGHTANGDVLLHEEEMNEEEDEESMPKVVDLLNQEGLIRPEIDDRDENIPVGDLTRESLTFPVERDVRLQNLARGDEGFLLALGYSTQRGFGNTHPFVGEIRMGEVSIEFVPEELGFPIEIGEITLTECETVNQFKGSKSEPPQFTRGYGLTFGHCERKAISMANVDRALRGRELGEELNSPAQDEEFVLYHSDNVQATGFVEHLKLPHYVDFQADLVMVRGMRAEAMASKNGDLSHEKGQDNEG